MDLVGYACPHISVDSAELDYHMRSFLVIWFTNFAFNTTHFNSILNFILHIRYIKQVICIEINSFCEANREAIIRYRAAIMTSSNGNIFRVTGPLCGEFPPQRPVTRSFDIFFDLHLNNTLTANNPTTQWAKASGIAIPLLEYSSLSTSRVDSMVLTNKVYACANFRSARPW